MCIIDESFWSFLHLLMENEGKTRLIGAFLYLFLFHSVEMWFGANFVKCLSSFIHAIGETFLLKMGERSRLGGEMELYNDIITFKFRHSKQINANPRFSVFTGRKDDPKPFIRWIIKIQILLEFRLPHIVHR